MKQLSQAILALILSINAFAVISQTRTLEVLDAQSEDHQVFGPGKLIDAVFDAVDKNEIQLYDIDYSRGTAKKSSLPELREKFQENLKITAWENNNYPDGSFVVYKDTLYMSTDEVLTGENPSDHWKWSKINYSPEIDREFVDLIKLDVYSKKKKRTISYANFYCRFWMNSGEYYAFSLLYSDLAAVLDKAGLLSEETDASAESYPVFWKGNMIQTEWDPKYDLANEFYEGKFINSMNSDQLPESYFDESIKVQLGFSPELSSKLEHFYFWKIPAGLLEGEPMITLKRGKADKDKNSPKFLSEAIASGNHTSEVIEQPMAFPPLVKSKFKPESPTGQFSIRIHEEIILAGHANSPFYRGDNHNLADILLQGINQRELKVLNRELNPVWLDEFRKSSMLPMPKIQEFDPTYLYDMGELVMYKGLTYRSISSIFGDTGTPDKYNVAWEPVPTIGPKYVDGSNVQSIHLVSDVITADDGLITDISPAYIGMSIPPEEDDQNSDESWRYYVQWTDAVSFLSKSENAITYDSLNNKFTPYIDKLSKREFVGFLERTEGVRFIGTSNQSTFESLSNNSNYTLRSHKIDMLDDLEGTSRIEMVHFLDTMMRLALEGYTSVTDKSGSEITASEFYDVLENWKNREPQVWDAGMPVAIGDLVWYEGHVYRAKSEHAMWDSPALMDSYESASWEAIEKKLLTGDWITQVEIVSTVIMNPESEILSSNPGKFGIYTIDDQIQFFLGYLDLTKLAGIFTHPILDTIKNGNWKYDNEYYGNVIILTDIK